MRKTYSLAVVGLPLATVTQLAQKLLREASSLTAFAKRAMVSQSQITQLIDARDAVAAASTAAASANYDSSIQSYRKAYDSFNAVYDDYAARRNRAGDAGHMLLSLIAMRRALDQMLTWLQNGGSAPNIRLSQTRRAYAADLLDGARLTPGDISLIVDRLTELGRSLTRGDASVIAYRIAGVPISPSSPDMDAIAIEYRNRGGHVLASNRGHARRGRAFACARKYLFPNDQLSLNWAKRMEEMFGPFVNAIRNIVEVDWDEAEANGITEDVYDEQARRVGGRVLASNRGRTRRGRSLRRTSLTEFSASNIALGTEPQFDAALKACKEYGQDLNAARGFMKPKLARDFAHATGGDGLLEQAKARPANAQKLVTTARNHITSYVGDLRRLPDRSEAVMKAVASGQYAMKMIDALLAAL